MSTSPPRIFVIEDEALITMEIQDHLKSLGYEVCGCSSRGEEAVELIPTAQADLILMDIRLAGVMSGIDTAQNLRDQAIDIPVVFLTAYSDDELVACAAQASAYGYLVKPIERNELKITIEIALHKSRTDSVLKKAENTARSAESFVQATIDALTSHVAVLDEKGVILATNRAWQQFAMAGETDCLHLAEGSNYLEFFDEKHETDNGTMCSKAAIRIAAGIHRVIAGTLPEFLLEYPCDSEDGRRWFRCQVTRFPGEGNVKVVVAHDNVTAAHDTRQELATSLSMFESLATVSPAGIFRTDIDGGCIYVNRRWQELAGMTMEEALGAGWTAAVHPDDAEGLMEAWSGLVQNKTDLQYELRFRRTDGLTTWLLAQAVTISDEQGEVTGFMGTITDVSEQKQTELALLALSTELNQLNGTEFFQAVAQTLSTLLECEVVFVCCSRRGPGDLTHVLAMFEDNKQLDSFTFDTNETPVAAALQGESIVIADDVHRKFPKDQYLREKSLVSYAAVPVTGRGGQILGHLACMSRRPLTNPKQALRILQLFTVSVAAELEQETSERRFKDIVELAPDGILLTDRQGVIRLVNSEAEKIFGWDRIELLGQKIEKLIPSQHRARHIQQRDGFISELEVRPMGANRPDLVALRKDGTTIPVEISIKPIETEEGMMIAAAVRDISERQKLERQVNRTQRLEAIGTLAGGIAHDLNNALSPIMLSLHLLKEEATGSTDILDLLESSVDRASGMVRQLLTFAKGEEGSRVSVQLKHLVGEIERIISSAFPKNIQLQLRLASDLPSVLGDATQLHQVLLNLCVNARDAMAEGGILTIDIQAIEVDTSFEAEAEPGSYIAVTVSDTGHGIPKEILDHVFDPFFTTKEPDRGTGLGLSTVLGLVKGHGGFLQVSSNPGEGSVFAVYLPAEPKGARIEEEPTRESNYRGEGQVVLYVDDEPRILETVRYALTDLNFVTLTAGDGTRALVQVAEHRTSLDVIITDLSMPNMDGLALAKTLQMIAPDVPVIVTTGRIDDETSAELSAAGVELVLPKPFTQAQLASALQVTLGVPVGTSD